MAEPYVPARKRATVPEVKAPVEAIEIKAEIKTEATVIKAEGPTTAEKKHRGYF